MAFKLAHIAAAAIATGTGAAPQHIIGKGPTTIGGKPAPPVATQGPCIPYVTGPVAHPNGCYYIKPPGPPSR